MGKNMIELRANIPPELMTIVDGYCQATGKSRTDVVTDVLQKWADQKVHESIIVCRVAGVNPIAMAKDRQP